MSAVSYKCPNCGGELKFDPKTQKFQCEYCISYFTEQELSDGIHEEEKSGGPGENAKEKEAEKAGQNREEGHAVVYSCPSCGAEMITEETTAATFCYYCHNPVILQGRVSGVYLPDRILPFRIDRKKAEQLFLENVQKKKFIPRAFFNKSQIEKLTGIYFPYWICDSQSRGSMRARATKVRVWRVGDLEYTETKFYQVEREGRAEFPEMTNNALKRANRELVEGVGPFPLESALPFSMGYLSGFQAEKRDQEQEEFRPRMEADVKRYSESMMRDSISGYAAVTPEQTEVQIEKMDFCYALLPVWTLTYQGKNGKIYYYAMNGITGKVCGKLPVDYIKVGILFLAVFVPVLLLGLLGGYLL